MNLSGKIWLGLGLVLGLSFRPGAIQSQESRPAPNRVQTTQLHSSLPEVIPNHSAPKVLPINLDSVFQLATDQNGQVALAREKLNEAFALHDLAGKRWLPDIYFGPSYYRHEGGIQDFNGRLIHSSMGSFFAGAEVRSRLDLRAAIFKEVDAARKIWQRKAELSKLTSENLLDAAGTYIDLLAARSGEAVALDLESKLKDLLETAQKVAKVIPELAVEVPRVQAELDSQQQIAMKLREGVRSATAKLIYLLGLDPQTDLVIMDKQIVAFHLVDARQSAQALVEEALTQGPGVRELEGLLATIEEARQKASGPGRFMPIVEVNLAEGAFGAGPGSGANWDNRLDLGLNLRWNLTSVFTAGDQRRLADSKIQQAHLTYQDLRAKLTLGIFEAREASLSNLGQVAIGEKQVENAKKAYDLSKQRLKDNLKGSSPTEVLLSIRALAGAQLNYITALRDLDKAQIRLFVLRGAVLESK